MIALRESQLWNPSPQPRLVVSLGEHDGRPDLVDREVKEPDLQAAEDGNRVAGWDGLDRLGCCMESWV